MTNATVISRIRVLLRCSHAHKAQYYGVCQLQLTTTSFHLGKTTRTEYYVGGSQSDRLSFVVFEHPKVKYVALNQLLHKQQEFRPFFIIVYYK